MPEIEEHEHLYGTGVYYAWLPKISTWVNGRYWKQGGIAHIMVGEDPLCNTEVRRHSRRYIMKPVMAMDVRLCKMCARKNKHRQSQA